MRERDDTREDDLRLWWLWMLVLPGIMASVLVAGIVWLGLALVEALLAYDWRWALAIAGVGLIIVAVSLIVRLIASVLAWMGHHWRGG